MKELEEGYEFTKAQLAELEQLRTTIAEQAKRIRHVEMALADTEALEMGTAETLGKAKARINALEDALRAQQIECECKNCMCAKEVLR